MRPSHPLIAFVFSPVLFAQAPTNSAAVVPGTGILRCGTTVAIGPSSPMDHPDCDANQTNPLSIYAPSNTLRIPVVVHVISNTSGTGNLSDGQVQSQIAVLNEDFRAKPGTAGAPGVDTKIEFFLATTDPSGNPTTGITRHTSNSWFSDSGSYWTSIAWDTARYLNIYTNTAGGALGYSYVPQAAPGILGSSADRVVVLHTTFGRPGSLLPYNLGRTATHEVGHYLGLYHTFDGGCGTSSCYTTGDRICDTAAEASSRFGCPGGAVSCGSTDPISNYMDYTDDSCMTGFSQEQARRMRCTLQHYRPSLAQAGGPSAQATTRNGAGNLNGRYSSMPPVLGQNMVAQILTVGTPYTLGAVFGYLGTASVPFQGQTILVDLGSAQIFELPLLPTSGLSVGWTVPVPNNPAIAGWVVSSQGALSDGATFSLTNAVDFVVGF